MTYPKAAYQAARATIRKRQEERAALIAARKNDLYTRYPRLLELEREMTGLAFRIFNDVSSGVCSPQDISQTLSRESARIQAERTAILAKDGKEADYFDPPFVCESCKDTGFVRDKMCACLKKAVSEELFSRSGLTEAMRSQTFAAMREDLYDDAPHPQLGCSVKEYMRNIRDICLDFTANFGSSPRNLLFYGASGLGKTYYSSAIANDLLGKGYSVLYVSAVELFATLQRKNFSNHDSDQTEYEILREQLLTADLLILDDLGTEMINNFSLPEFFGILNARLLSGRSMIFSTNLALTDIKELYSERIASRLAGTFTLCRFVGEDLRLSN